MILASHDTNIVNTIGRRVVSMDKGKIVRDQVAQWAVCNLGVSLSLGSNAFYHRSNPQRGFSAPLKVWIHLVVNKIILR